MMSSTRTCGIPEWPPLDKLTADEQTHQMALLGSSVTLPSLSRSSTAEILHLQKMGEPQAVRRDPALPEPSSALRGESTWPT